FFEVLAGRSLPARTRPAELRQAVRPGLPAHAGLGQDAAGAGAPPGRRRPHAGALYRGVRDAYGRVPLTRADAWRARLAVRQIPDEAWNTCSRTSSFTSGTRRDRRSRP